ncbi:J domain-containing protein [Mycena kentingensis (nom. inval.)]|nr:J domain-containing protein [Mycena kentingensis (nom. inval.)]
MMHLRRFCSSSRRAATHYDILGLTRSASAAQIKSAFFALSKKHHPDVPGHKNKPEFHEITTAYNVLRDPVSRRAYDNTLPDTSRAAPSSMHSRHMADTAARYRRAASSARSAPRSSPSSSSSTSRRSTHASEPPFRRRAPAADPILDQHDRAPHQHHPGQRYRPPDPNVQAARWAVKKELMREEKTRTPRYVVGMVSGVAGLFAMGWVVGVVAEWRADAKRR